MLRDRGHAVEDQKIRHGRHRGHDQKKLIKFLRGWSNATPGRIKKAFAYKLDDWEMPEDIGPAVRLFVREVVEGGVYAMETEMESDIGFEQFVFEIQENELK